MHGPGVKLVVDDAKDTEQGGGGPRESSGFSDTGRVRDRDMQRVVNGLWESGAEAVSINGQRLTSLSAIRAAGDAILVDNKPLVPPYTVLAVGTGSGSAPRSRTAPTASTCTRCRRTSGSAPASRPRRTCVCRPRRA